MAAERHLRGVEPSAKDESQGKAAVGFRTLRVINEIPKLY